MCAIPASLEPPYHLCVTVRDIDEAMARYSATLGIPTWTPGVVADRSYLTANRTLVTTRVTAVFSHSGPPHLELIESHDEPHTLWPTSESGRIDHMGMHAANAEIEVERLLAGGYSLEAEFVDVEESGEVAPRCVYYVRGSDGVRIEIVDISRKGHLRNWLTTGTHAAPGS